MTEYSIAEFLEALVDDKLEKEMIKMISEGLHDEGLLTKLLELMGRKSNADV